jgi:hypothetical protein
MSSALLRRSSTHKWWQCCTSGRVMWRSTNLIQHNLLGRLWPAAGSARPRLPKGRRGGGISIDHHLSTPPGGVATSTPEGSPSRHILLSPPPPPSPPVLPPLGTPHCWTRFETRVIPRTTEIDAVEALLGNALVALIGGSRPVTSPSQVLYVLSRHYQVTADSVRVCRYQAEAFLLTFHDRQEVDQVLHTTPPEGADWRLVFKRWTH